MSRPQRERHICTMKTQTPPAQSKPEMLALKNILVPLDFSPASNNAAKKERMMETTVESLATRVALHPFLVGMKSTAIGVADLLRDDCSIQQRTSDFPRRRTRGPVLFDRNRKGSPGVDQRAGTIRSWGGRGCFHLIPGPSRRVPSSQPPPSSFTGQPCASIARGITRSVTNS